MPDTLDLVAAVRDLIADHDDFDLYEGAPPDVVSPTRPYGIYYPNPSTALKTSLAAGYRRARWEFRIVVCGWTVTQTIHAANTIRDLLTGVRIDTHPSSSPLNEVDNSSTVLESAAMTATQAVGVLPRYSYTLQYRLHTVR